MLGQERDAASSGAGRKEVRNNVATEKFVSRREIFHSCLTTSFSGEAGCDVVFKSEETMAEGW